MKTWKPKIFGVAAMAALVCLLTAGQVGAYDQEDLDRLLATNSCDSCNLREVNLGGADLSGANLTMADLKAAHLNEANLSGATWTDGRLCAEGSIGRCK